MTIFSRSHTASPGFEPRGFRKAAAALVGLAAELLFQRSLADPRYWKRREDGGLVFSPDPEVLKALVDLPNLDAGGVFQGWDPTKP